MRISPRSALVNLIKLHINIEKEVVCPALEFTLELRVLLYYITCECTLDA